MRACGRALSEARDNIHDVESELLHTLQQAVLGLVAVQVVQDHEPLENERDEDAVQKKKRMKSSMGRAR